MSNQFNSDEDLLARLVREAGDPGAGPDPQYARTLEETILDRVGSADTEIDPTEATRDANLSPTITLERTRKMKRIAKFAVAITVLVAVCIMTSRLTRNDGSTNIAFANVVAALDGLQSATYDYVAEMKDPSDEEKTQQHSIKGQFLAPSRERIEMSIGSGKAQGSSIMIVDYQAGKGLVLSPQMKLAIVMDMSKLERPADTSNNMFEFVRRVVREGSGDGGEKAEPLGKKQIDGRQTVGFQVHTTMADVTLWADPQTARPVRIELEFPSSAGHGVMSNFRYDMELDPALFSFEPPPGYTVQTKNATMPGEDDLIDVLRLVAEYNQDTFPAAIGMFDKECMQASQAAAKLEGERIAKTPEAKELMEKLKAEYGEDKQGLMIEWMKQLMPQIQKLTEKYMQGMLFHMTLKPENDPHYVGGGVKLDAPDCPILWYKPTGAEKYRVIYADLSVKEMTPDEVKKLPQATPK